MDTIICWFYTIPNTIYAAITASLITLLGVYLSNKAANKRLITQLSIESDERKHEREVNLRNEVYLKTAEELTKAQQYIVSLANSDLSNLQNQQKTLEGFFSSTSKIHIVGTDETIEAVVNVTRQFTISTLQIMKNSMPLHDMKYDINTLSDLINDNSSKRENYLNQMKAINLNGNRDEGLWDKLQDEFNVVHDEIETDEDKRSKKWDEHNTYLRKLIIECMEETTVMTDLIALAIISIRKEIGLPFDGQGYIKLMKKQSLETKAIIKPFLSELEKGEHT